MLGTIDHVIFVVPDLDAATREHRGRGFTVTRGGEHADGRTHNALVGFADGSYLELLAFHDLGRARDHRWAPVAERGGGWADFALRSDDLAADAEALGDLVTQTPQERGRTRPDGVRITWRAALLRPPLPFLIEDVTDRALRVPGGAAAAHANGTGRIVRVVLGGRDPAAIAARYARLRARGAPEIELRRAERDGLLDVILG